MTIEIGEAVKEFEAALPGFWYSAGQNEEGAHAACGPDVNGGQPDLLKGLKRGDPLEGLHCNTKGSPAEALRDVMRQVLRHLEELGTKVRGLSEGAKGWNTDAADFAAAVKELEATLPGFWWLAGQGSPGAYASCGVDEERFDCDTLGGSPAGALRHVMQQAQGLVPRRAWGKTCKLGEALH
jgi:hypothetical protein